MRRVEQSLCKVHLVDVARVDIFDRAADGAEYSSAENVLVRFSTPVGYWGQSSLSASDGRACEDFPFAARLGSPKPEVSSPRRSRRNLASRAAGSISAPPCEISHAAFCSWSNATTTSYQPIASGGQPEFIDLCDRHALEFRREARNQTCRRARLGTAAGRSRASWCRVVPQCHRFPGTLRANPTSGSGRRRRTSSGRSTHRETRYQGTRTCGSCARRRNTSTASRAGSSRSTRLMVVGMPLDASGGVDCSDSLIL